MNTRSSVLGKIGIGITAHDVELGIGADGAGPVIAERNKIQSAGCQDCVISRLGVEGDAPAGQKIAGIGGIAAPGHGVHKIPALPAALHVTEYVFRLAGGGIDFAQGIHGAKLGARHHFVAQLDRLGAGQEHVVHSVVMGLVVGLSGAAGRKAADRIDLVEGQPVAAPLAEPLKQSPAVPQIAVDGVAAGPAVILQGQSGWQLVVMNGDQGCI